MNRLFYISLVVLVLLILSAGIGIASAQQDVLRLDVDKSYIINLDTGGTKAYYKDFLNTEQLEGHTLEFHIYVDKVEKTPILDEYVLKLETNLEGPPEWKFGDDFRRSAEWIVWKGREEHELPMRPIILTGEVPKPIIPVEEPGFEAYKETKGIGKREVYVRLTVGTTKDGSTLETIDWAIDLTNNTTPIYTANGDRLPTAVMQGVASVTGSVTIFSQDGVFDPILGPTGTEGTVSSPYLRPQNTWFRVQIMSDPTTGNEKYVYMEMPAVLVEGDDYSIRGPSEVTTRAFSLRGFGGRCQNSTSGYILPPLVLSGAPGTPAGSAGTYVVPKHTT